MYHCDACDTMKPDEAFGDSDDNICNDCYPRIKKQRAKEEAQRLAGRAAKHGFTKAQMLFIESLEWKIQRLSEKLERLEDR